MPKFVMLAGAPCSGKSYYSNNFYEPAGWVRLSTDEYIETRAREEGKSYSEVFDQYIKPAQAEMERRLQEAIRNNNDIIWDQTNLSKYSRIKKLNKIPEHYTKTIVYLYTDDVGFLLFRNDRRAVEDGKFIPRAVIKRMLATQELPTLDEGWDSLHIDRIK